MPFDKIMEFGINCTTLYGILVEEGLAPGVLSLSMHTLMTLTALNFICGSFLIDYSHFPTQKNILLIVKEQKLSIFATLEHMSHLTA